MVMNGSMIRLLGLVLAAQTLLGCRKPAEAVSSPPPEAHAPMAQADLAIGDSNSLPRLEVSPTAELDVVLAQLTREVRKWIVRHQRPPKDFEEFAASAAIQIPSAPAGKKFALSKPMRVIVVNR